MRRPTARPYAIAALIAAVLIGDGVAMVARRGPAGGADAISDRYGAPLGQRIGLQLRAAGVEHGRTTLDASIQSIAEQALDAGLARARGSRDAAGRRYHAEGGSLIVVDLADDSVAGLASGPEIGMIRAGAAAPPGSIVKPLTAIGAIDAGLVDARESLACPATFSYAGGEFRNRRAEDRPDMTVSDAIADSCDTVFYGMAARSWVRPDAIGHTAIERAFADFGLGAPTGVIAGEAAGASPRAAGRAGDLVAMSAGEGPLTATPLQVARAYASLARGKPVALKSITGAGGIAAGRAPTPAALQAIRAGLHAAPAFAGLAPSIDLMSASASAEAAGQQPWSWFAAFAPAARPRYLIVATIQEGGHGAAAAVRAVLDDIRRHDPHAFDLPAPILPGVGLIAAIVLSLLVGLASPGAGAFAGGAVGAALDLHGGAGLGPAFVALAGAGWLLGRARDRAGAAGAMAIATAFGLFAYSWLRMAFGSAASAPFTVEALRAVIGAALVAGPVLASSLGARLLRRLRDVA